MIASEQQQTKLCIQCGKNCTKDQFPKKQWNKEEPSCRFCNEFTDISAEDSRQCNKCMVVLRRNKFSVHAWKQGKNALCVGCCPDVTSRAVDMMDNKTSSSGIKDLADGTTVCAPHSLERCDVCMMDFTFPNQLSRERKALGRELDDAEAMERVMEQTKGINQTLCILDGEPICPRTGRKLRCCQQVVYCSVACQKHHWPIHKMTCEKRVKAKALKAVAK